MNSLIGVILAYIVYYLVKNYKKKSWQRRLIRAAEERAYVD